MVISFEEKDRVAIEKSILKPCPFCGGEAHVMKKECLSNGYVTYGIFHSMFEHANCVLSGQSLDAVFETEEQAIKAWNTRL